MGRKSDNLNPGTFILPPNCEYSQIQIHFTVLPFINEKLKLKSQIVIAMFIILVTWNLAFLILCYEKSRKYQKLRSNKRIISKFLKT